MPATPERATGVGEQADGTVRTELLDFLATEGLRQITLLTSSLRRLNQDYPHRTELASHTFFLEQLAAYAELGLSAAGYGSDDISRIASSPLGLQLRRDD